MFFSSSGIGAFLCKEHFAPLLGHSNPNYMVIISIILLQKWGEFFFFYFEDAYQLEAVIVLTLDAGVW